MDVYTTSWQNFQKETRIWAEVARRGSSRLRARRGDNSLADAEIEAILSGLEGVLERMVEIVDRVRAAVSSETGKTRQGVWFLLRIEAWLHAYEAEYENKVFWAEQLCEVRSDDPSGDKMSAAANVGWDSSPFLDFCPTLHAFVSRALPAGQARGNAAKGRTAR